MTDRPNPGRIFDTLNAHQQSAALRGAIELQVFTLIGRGHGTAEALAERCEATPRAMRILCDYLVVHEFLTKDGQSYGLTPLAATYLDKSSPSYMGAIAKFVNAPDQLRAFTDVAELVREGRTQLEGSGTTSVEYEGWVEFARCMVPMMKPAAAFIGALVADLKSGPTRVLDVAAGHGLFGIAVAQANLEAKIVALDWPQVLEVATKNAGTAGILDRYSLLPGDALSVDFGEQYDVVLLTNFLHHFDRPTCESVFRKAYRALQADGCVVILEFVPNEDRVSPPVPATFAFTMLGTTPAGDAYTFAEYESMGTSVGFASSTMTDVPNSPQRVIVVRK